MSHEYVSKPTQSEPKTQHDEMITSPLPQSGINHILYLQQTIGNQATMQLLRQQSVVSNKKAIQRLNTSEEYLKQYEGASLHWINSGMSKLREKAGYQQMVKQIEKYRKYARKNKFQREKSSKLIEMLDEITTTFSIFESDVNDFIDLVNEESNPDEQEDIGKFEINIRRELVGDLLADIGEEFGAIETVMADEAVPDKLMSWKDVIFIARLGQSPSTVLTKANLAPGNGKNARGNPQNLSGGAISTVTQLDYVEGDETKTRVFKPNEEEATTPTDTLIHGLNVQTSIRAMAVARVQDLIREKMNAAGREFKSLVGNFDIAQYNGQIGTVADKADGKDGYKTFRDKAGKPVKAYELNVDISDIEIQQQLANLQLFDMITGQIDRHMGNVMIQQGMDKESKVTGIDNDFSFAKQTNIESSIGRTPMPEKVDRYFAEAILSIDAGEFFGQLNGLQESDKERALERFDAIKNTLQQMLDDNLLLVAPNDDTYPDAPNWLGVDINSYRTGGYGDYAGKLNEPREKAFEAMVNDPAIQLDQDEKGRWIIKYGPDDYLQASEENGDDLRELVRLAKDERERRWQSANSTSNDRSRINIGEGGRRKRGLNMRIGNNRRGSDS